MTPPFSGPKLLAARQLNYDSSTKVLALVKRRFWEADDGIYGGGTAADLPIGFTYYPSDNATTKDPAVSAAPAVLLASYTWGQPARRLAALSQKDACQVVRENLARIHPQLLREEHLIIDMVRWSWDTYPSSSGAFAWFLPGQHTALHHDLLTPEG